MASGMYNSGKAALVNGSIDWDTSDIRVLLLQGTGYVFNPDHNYVSDLTPATNEANATNYVRKSLTGRTVTVDTVNDRAVCDAADVTWTALGGAVNNTISAAVVYLYNAADTAAQLICYQDFTDTATNGGDFNLVWNSAGLFYL